MSRMLALLLILSFTSSAAGAEKADPLLDAPEARDLRPAAFIDALSYGDALRLWKTPEDVNAWIGARFKYSLPRALLLAKDPKDGSGRLAIQSPEEFFTDPTGVCVDLARFAVETLKIIDPGCAPAYLKIEFAPVTMAGSALRFHWLAVFQRDGRRFFFADSKRPGHVAGPYAAVGEFIEEYDRFRGRRIVAFEEVESYRRRLKTPRPQPGTLSPPP